MGVDLAEFYVVCKGDSWISIAKALGIPVNALIGYNDAYYMDEIGHVRVRLLTVGELVKIPEG